jgi:hypothetical protein
VRPSKAYMPQRQFRKLLMRAAIFCALVVTLSACDFLYGVRRYSKINELPQLDCVSRVIRATPGVASVEARKQPTDRDYPPHDVYDFGYRGVEGSSIKGVVQFETGRGSVEFEDTDFWLNAKPPQQEIDATRPVMQRIETSLVNQCGVMPISRIREQCFRVNCQPLSK